MPTMDEKSRARARKLLAMITSAAAELETLLGADRSGEGSEFDYLDRERRRRPEWRRRGRVFYLIDKAGGRIDDVGFLAILLQAGYQDGRGAAGFFRGEPIAVLERDEDDVVLTERGKHGARFYERYWLPKETDWAP
jgi:hypothetical protein